MQLNRNVQNIYIGIEMLLDEREIESSRIEYKKTGTRQIASEQFVIFPMKSDIKMADRYSSG